MSDDFTVTQIFWICIVALLVNIVILYYVIYYSVKAATKRIQEELDLTNRFLELNTRFLMTQMVKMGIPQETIDEDYYTWFPELEEDESEEDESENKTNE